MPAHALALHHSFVSSQPRSRPASVPVRLPRSATLAEAVIGISVAVLLTAGSFMTMAADLERSFQDPLERVQTSPSGRVGVVTVESGIAFLL